jgi:hypothetical protein
MMTTVTPMHADLKLVKELLYDKCGLDLTDLALNVEGSEYAACSFKLNQYKIEHRSSKITPKKTGQFVTVWKRNKDKVTEPFNILDDINFIVITSRNDNDIGQFIFPKAVLADKGIIIRDGNGGKRGIRVYPPWDTPTSEQAKKTQKWQTKYFVKLDTDNIGIYPNVQFDTPHILSIIEQ